MVVEVICKLECGEFVEKKNPIEEKVFTISNVGLYMDSRTY